MEQNIQNNILEIITSAPADRASWVAASTFGRGVKRRAFKRAEKFLLSFIENPTNSTWLIMPGLRGIGKTTILSQLYDTAPAPSTRKFYVSMERISLIGGTTNDVIGAIEEIMGEQFDTVGDPVFIFLDEVQYQDDWSLALKTVFDRTKSIFIVCTGSSAIALQSNPDIARRSLKLPVHPLCFTEYVMIRQAHENVKWIDFPSNGLSKAIKEALFESKDPTQVLVRLQELRPKAAAYWRQLPTKDEYVYDYLKFGTLPFTLRDTETVVRWQKINALLNESLARDIDSARSFDQDTRALFPRLLFLIANSDVISHDKLASTMGINERTVVNMLGILTKTEILHPIPPRGSAYKKVSRATKYLFTSPAMRAAMCTSGGVLGEERASLLRGRLLEDAVGMYLKRLFSPSETPAILEYDHDAGGADFIVSQTGQKEDTVTIEVGAKKRSANQVATTLSRTGGKYGLVISSAGLSIDTTKNAVFIPFDIFLLL